jgi:hypothetical protein
MNLTERGPFVQNLYTRTSQDEQTSGDQNSLTLVSAGSSNTSR